MVSLNYRLELVNFCTSCSRSITLCSRGHDQRGVFMVKLLIGTYSYGHTLKTLGSLSNVVGSSRGFDSFCCKFSVFVGTVKQVYLEGVQPCHVTDLSIEVGY